MTDRIHLGGVQITHTCELDLEVHRGTRVYSTLNAEIYQYAQEQPEFKVLLNHDASRVCIDGQWVLWALRRKYRDTVPLKKNSGSELIFRIPAICAQRGLRLTLLGASARSNRNAVARLAAEYPDLTVEGFSPPISSLPLSDEFRQGVMRFLARVRPDVIVCAFGPPKEQVWAIQHLNELNALGVSCVMCFGGALDMLSGEVRRAPVWMKRSGLEGIYRIWHQPERISRLPRVLKFLRVVLRPDGEDGSQRN